MDKIDNQIKTSVIIPIYNTKDYLDECIQSVINQTQKELEIILVDDGSTDGSGDMIREYAEKYSFIKAIHQKNKKLGAARNAGVKIAVGEYIYFLDSDDYISEGTLEECYQIAKRQELDFLMFDAITFCEEGVDNAKEKDTLSYDRSNLSIEDRVYTGVEFWQQYYNKSGVYPMAYLVYINREFYKRNDLSFEENVFYEDNDWSVQMYRYAKRIAYIPENFYYRRYRAGSIMLEHYTDTHFYSTVVLSKKMISMMLDIEDCEVRCMAESVTCGILSRLNSIMRTYHLENRLQSVQNEILSLMEYLYKVKEEIFAISRNIKMVVLQFINMTICFFEECEKVNYWKSYMQQLVKEELRVYPLQQRERAIGIYGRGALCRRFLMLYEQYVGAITAQLFFIDTSVETQETCLGYPVYNVRGLSRLNLDCVIIASFKHKDDMIQNVLKYGEKNIAMQELPELLKYWG